MKSGVRADESWSVHGLRVVTLENDLLRLDVIPALGAKLFRFIHKATDTDVLWHHPRIPLRPVPLGASYDDNFFGGWDELFPNDAAGMFEGTAYPDHGELWSQEWSHRLTTSDDCVELYLRLGGAVTPTILERWITLAPHDNRVRIRYRITNVGSGPLDFLWKLHPALSIDPGDRLDIPGRRGELVDPGFGAMREPMSFEWPRATHDDGSVTDLSAIPAMSGSREFVYVRELTAGWCALRRMRRGVGVGLAFDLTIFNNVWVFMTFGGWRGLETLVLEPCTTYPKDLGRAIQQGTCSHLEAGESLETAVTAVLFDRPEHFSGIDSTGAVIR